MRIEAGFGFNLKLDWIDDLSRAAIPSNWCGKRAIHAVKDLNLCCYSARRLCIPADIGYRGI